MKTMKNMKIKKIIIAILCLGLGVIIIMDSQGISEAIVKSIQLCLTTIIPSLFAFMALSAFLIKSGIVRGDFAIFILSVTGGYPVGINLLKDIKKSRAETMLMYCYCGSPIFIMAIANNGIYIWLSNMLACLIFAVIIYLMNIRNKPTFQKTEPVLDLSAETFIKSITGAGSALYRVCLMVILFGIVIRTMEFTGLMQVLPDEAYAFLEISKLMNISTSPPVTAALTSFGGVCIISQIVIISNGRINLMKFLLARIPIAVLSATICHILTRHITVTASTPHPIISSAGNPIASVCLLIMSFILINTVRSENTPHK
ncbi:MAG: hypothetical protein FWD34_02400 [Oscillospiraceae bacterium]|nr:hypothetical protein [Oscillospiraceae bacterium]